MTLELVLAGVAGLTCGGLVVALGTIRSLQANNARLLDRIQARDLTEYHAVHPVQETEPVPRRIRHTDPSGLIRQSFATDA